MFASFTKLFAAALLATAGFASAGPIAAVPVERIVYNPQITSPKAGDIWVGGTETTVTWSTDGMPSELAASTGLILLGHVTTGDNENLDTAHPLANYFPMNKGSVTFNIPQVDNRTDYVIVLFGDSGNKSPAFTIANTNVTASGLLGIL